MGTPLRAVEQQNQPTTTPLGLFGLLRFPHPAISVQKPHTHILTHARAQARTHKHAQACTQNCAAGTRNLFRTAEAVKRASLEDCCGGSSRPGKLLLWPLPTSSASEPPCKAQTKWPCCTRCEYECKMMHNANLCKNLTIWQEATVQRTHSCKSVITWPTPAHPEQPREKHELTLACISPSTLWARNTAARCYIP